MTQTKKAMEVWGRKLAAHNTQYGIYSKITHTIQTEELMTMTHVQYIFLCVCVVAAYQSALSVQAIIFQSGLAARL